MTEFTNTTPQAQTVTVSGLATLGAGAYSFPSSLLDNTPTNSYSKSFLRGTMRLSFSSGVVVGATNPTIVLYRLLATDGTNVASPPASGTTNQPPANVPNSVSILPPSSTIQYVDFGPFELDPFKYSFQFYNNSGTAFSGSVSATLYTWDVQGN